MLSAALLLAVVPTLSAAPPPPPIVNGTETALYPDVVLLRWADAGWNAVFVCSGVLLDAEWVLTAAHCVVDTTGYSLVDMHAFSGAHWTASAAEVSADDWFPHPDYSVSSDASVIRNDLGLVHLATPLSAVPTSPLNEAALSEADVGTTLRWVGWGATGDYTYDAGYDKRYADMQVVGLEVEFLLGYDEGGSATCGGDSGGAVFRLDGGGNPTLVAIHAFGRDDDGTLCDGSTSGDTRVDLYPVWIGTRGEELDDAADSGGDAGDSGGDAGDSGGDDGADSGADSGGEDSAGGCGCAGAGGASPGLVAAVAGLVLAGARRRR